MVIGLQGLQSLCRSTAFRWVMSLRQVMMSRAGLPAFGGRASLHYHEFTGEAWTIEALPPYSHIH